MICQRVENKLNIRIEPPASHLLLHGGTFELCLWIHASHRISYPGEDF